jgi:hypothetical protein
MKHSKFIVSYVNWQILMNRNDMQRNYKLAIKKILEAGFWFIDIPRTSSSSLRIELGKRFGIPYGKKNLLDSKYSSEQIFPDHLTALEMKRIIGSDNWGKIFSFTIVRNPWDRVLSMYFYRRIKKNIPENWSFSDYLYRLDNMEKHSNYFNYHGFILGASDYILDESDNILVKLIIKFEDRINGIKTVSEKLKVNNLGIIHTQISKPVNLNYRSYYNNYTKDLIKKKYQKDIELFDYRF